MVDFRWLLLSAACAFMGCGDPQGGGGTDLPSPIQFIILDNGSHSGTSGRAVSPSQCRLWSVESQTSDSIDLLSNGVLSSDTSGVFTLPADSGTYLVEAWEKHPTPPTILLRKRVPSSILSTSSCRQSLGRSASVSKIPFCSADSMQEAITDSASIAPEHLSLIHVQGEPLHPFRLRHGPDTVLIVESRLWSFEGDSMVFRGVLRSHNSKIAYTPGFLANRWYALEAWNEIGQAPGTVPVFRPNSDVSTRPNHFTSSTRPDCALTLGAIGSGTITFFACDTLHPDFAKDSANSWVMFAYEP